MILKGFPQAPMGKRLRDIEVVKDQAYVAPIRDTVAFKKGGVVKPHGKKGSKAMKDHMARLRAMRK